MFPLVGGTFLKRWLRFPSFNFFSRFLSSQAERVAKQKADGDTLHRFSFLDRVGVFQGVDMLQYWCEGSARQGGR